MACLLKNEPTSFFIFLFKSFRDESIVKASVKSAIKKEDEEDPKPSELAMARMNFVEIRREVRTQEPCNTLG